MFVHDGHFCAKEIFIIPPNRPDLKKNLTSTSSWISDHNLRATTLLIICLWVYFDGPERTRLHSTTKKRPTLAAVETPPPPPQKKSTKESDNQKRNWLNEEPCVWQCAHNNKTCKKPGLSNGWERALEAAPKGVCGGGGGGGQNKTALRSTPKTILNTLYLLSTLWFDSAAVRRLSSVAVTSKAVEVCGHCFVASFVSPESSSVSVLCGFALFLILSSSVSVFAERVGMGVASCHTAQRHSQTTHTHKHTHAASIRRRGLDPVQSLTLYLRGCTYCDIHRSLGELVKISTLINCKLTRQWP